MVLPAYSGLSGQLGGGPQSRAGGDPHQNTLGADQLPSGSKCVLVPDPDDLIVDAPVQGVGDEVGADPLDLVGASLAAGEQGGGVGLHRRHVDGGVLLLQIAGGAPERVPPVPTQATSTSTLPCVSAQISGPVVR